ncbi:hypothetical protein ACVLD2_004805, partial [Paenibacillus sp. PvR052]
MECMEASTTKKASKFNHGIIDCDVHQGVKS